MIAHAANILVLGLGDPLLGKNEGMGVTPPGPPSGVKYRKVLRGKKTMNKFKLSWRNGGHCEVHCEYISEVLLILAIQGWLKELKEWKEITK